MHATQVGTDVIKAAQLLAAGNVVAIPTETVYGLAANALNPDAVVKIFSIKGRPKFNPLIVHVPSIQAASNYVTAINDLTYKLASHFLPGPLSILLPRNMAVIPDIVCAGLPKVAIRIPNNAMALDLLNAISFPLCAPSANMFGYVSPTSAKHVLQGLQGNIPYILDAGESTIGLESTIVECINDTTIQVHRLGGLAVETIQQALPNVKIETTIPIHEQPQTSGQLKSHYATTTPLYYGTIENLLQNFTNTNIGIISLSKKYTSLNNEIHNYILSPNGSLETAAKNIFATLRLADGKHHVILAESMPNTGLGPAINDRLYRAQQVFKK